MGGGQIRQFAQFGPIADPSWVTPPHPLVRPQQLPELCPANPKIVHQQVIFFDFAIFESRWWVFPFLIILGHSDPLWWLRLSFRHPLEAQ